MKNNKINVQFYQLFHLLIYNVTYFCLHFQSLLLFFQFEFWIVQMGNNQICKNCQRTNTQQTVTYRNTNKRKIVSLSYNTKENKTTQFESSIKQINEFSVPQTFTKFSGYGKIQYKPGWIYQGNLLRGIREGRGKMSWPTGDYYQGDFINGRANGRGIFQLSNGTRYQGEFVNDQIIKGKRLSEDSQQIYEGSFLNHLFDGYGVLIVANQFQYIGMFRKNMMEGSGKVKYVDGSSYDGSFKMNKKHGYGIYIYANGYRYEGYWKQGERYGQAVVSNSYLKGHSQPYNRFEIVF